MSICSCIGCCTVQRAQLHLKDKDMYCVGVAFRQTDRQCCCSNPTKHISLTLFNGVALKLFCSAFCITQNVPPTTTFSLTINYNQQHTPNMSLHCGSPLLCTHKNMNLTKTITFNKQRLHFSLRTQTETEESCGVAWHGMTSV